MTDPFAVRRRHGANRSLDGFGGDIDFEDGPIEIFVI